MQGTCSLCGYKEFDSKETIAVSITPSILEVIKNIVLHGWKLRKKTGRYAEIIKGDDTCRVAYSVFAGLKHRGLIKEMPNSEYFVLAYKAEAMITGKWPYYVIYAGKEFGPYIKPKVITFY
jgi:hypothetical protein